MNFPLLPVYPCMNRASNSLKYILGTEQRQRSAHDVSSRENVFVNELQFYLETSKESAC